MKLSIGCDHGGYEAKEIVKSYLEKKDHEVIDCGTFSTESCDYPIFAKKAAELVANGEAEKGILICSSGEGVCICANKVRGIRCGIGYNDDVSHLLVEHNHANIIAFGAKFMDINDILHRIDIFLSSEPLGDRHQRRVDLIEK